MEYESLLYFPLIPLIITSLNCSNVIFEKSFFISLTIKLICLSVGLKKLSDKTHNEIISDNTCGGQIDNCVV